MARPKIIYPFAVRVRTAPAEEFSKGGLQATTNQRVDLLFSSLPQALNFLSMLFAFSRVLESYGVMFEGLLHRTKTKEIPLVQAEKVFGKVQEVAFTDEMGKLLARFSQSRRDICESVRFHCYSSGPFEVGISAGRYPPRLSQFRFPSEALQAVETFFSNEVFFRRLGLYFYSFEYRPQKNEKTFPLLTRETLRPLNGPAVTTIIKTTKLEEVLDIFNDLDQPIELPKPRTAIISEVQLV